METIAVEALKTPWTFFLTQHINEETLRKYQQELQSAKDAARAMKMYLTNLQKTGLAVQLERKLMLVMDTPCRRRSAPHVR